MVRASAFAAARRIKSADRESIGKKGSGDRGHGVDAGTGQNRSVEFFRKHGQLRPTEQAAYEQNTKAVVGEQVVQGRNGESPQAIGRVDVFTARYDEIRPPVLGQNTSDFAQKFGEVVCAVEHVQADDEIEMFVGVAQIEEATLAAVDFQQSAASLGVSGDALRDPKFFDAS